MAFARVWLLFAALVLFALSSVHGLDEELRSADESRTTLTPQVPSANESSAVVQSSSLAAQSGAETKQKEEAAVFATAVATSDTPPSEKNTTAEILETATSSNIQQQQQQQPRVDESKLSAATTTTTPAVQHKSSEGNSASVGTQSALILIAGAAICAVLAITFKKQMSVAKKKHDRDAKDPMKQSLLYSDLDYAAI